MRVYRCFLFSHFSLSAIGGGRSFSTLLFPWNFPNALSVNSSVSLSCPHDALARFQLLPPAHGGTARRKILHLANRSQCIHPGPASSFHGVESVVCSNADSLLNSAADHRTKQHSTVTALHTLNNTVSKGFNQMAPCANNHCSTRYEQSFRHNKHTHTNQKAVTDKHSRHNHEVHRKLHQGTQSLHNI